jgi:hypothetical protein
MRLVPVDQAPTLPEDLVFRPSRLRMLLGILVCGILLAPALFLPPWIRWFSAGILLLMMLWMMTQIAAAFFPACWVLRYNGRRILLKIGPPTGRDPTRVFVAEFQTAEIEWARSFQQITITREGSEIIQRSTTWLELKPRLPDLQELQSCLQTATAPRTHAWHVGTIPMSTSSSSPGAVPVTLTADGIVRIEWHSDHLIVTPSLKHALRLLEKEIPTQPSVTERQDFTQSAADQQKIEQQILDYVAQGQILQATQLARERYGYSLTQARQFIADLQGHENPPLQAPRLTKP